MDTNLPQRDNFRPEKWCHYRSNNNFPLIYNDIQESQNVLIVTVHKQQCSNTYIQAISQTFHVQESRFSGVEAELEAAGTLDLESGGLILPSMQEEHFTSAQLSISYWP
ncbi:hypothetical protein NC652_032405 [Populus alba x Populus x berolinensis]|nr:hypothetical protein NC652_032405 [Populus alba x Populus x berolinensis]